MKNKIILFSVLFLLVVAVYLSVGGYSVLTEEQIGNCRIILDGDVCDNYEDCIYGSERDISCIKGYEIKEMILGEDFMESNLVVGGSNE